MMNFYQKWVPYYYNLGKYTNQDIATFVKCGVLTKEDYKQITNEEYGEQQS